LFIPKSRAIKIFQFGLASALGFLVAEAILAIGVIAIFHAIDVPGFATSSRTILGLDILAFGIGVTVAFAINEKVTFTHQEEGSNGWKSRIYRWGKYQVASLIGNLIIVIVQLVLLGLVSLSPVIGSIAGAIVSYPMTYALSTYFVWGSRSVPTNGARESPSKLAILSLEDSDQSAHSAQRIHNNRLQTGGPVC